MPIPLSYYSIVLADNTLKPSGEPETTIFKVPITTLTPGNVSATEGLAGALATALAGVVIGNFIKNETVYARNEVGAGPAGSTLAQRENKWLLRYHDATNNVKYQVSVGTADLTKVIPNSEFVDLTAGAGLAVKTAFEAVVVSPGDSSHSVILDSMQFVGRNT